MWCIPKVTPEFIKRMESLLALYTKPYNPKEPVICLDEKSKQLLKNKREGIPTRSGVARKQDYEYERNGTRNIFMTVEPKGGFRTAHVTEKRKRPDFAEELNRIINLPRYANAVTIHLVVDNLNTHNEKSLIETFGKEKTKRMMRRIIFHYTPKHASWLNMAEIEIGVLERQCTKRRIPSAKRLTNAVMAWEKRRNGVEAKINWKFTIKDARNVFKY